MRMRSCTIWGFDGFDPDVAQNLVRFYRRLGLLPALSNSPRAADLLVLQRAPDAPLDFRPFGAVHIWDYVGTPIARLLEGSAGAERVTVFASSEERATQLRGAANGSGATIHVQVPPVKTALWVSPPRRVEHGTVHIGNYKPYYSEGDDVFATRFFAAVQQRRAEVWGNGWSEAVPRARGSLGLFRVSGVYARSGMALGMMYPFQRPVSFSGRFWHAPLNGCVLASEPSVYAGRWPGVLETDYTPSDLDRIAASRVSTLREEARTFWDDHWTSMVDVVGEEIERLADTSRTRPSVIALAKSEGRLAAQRIRR